MFPLLPRRWRDWQNFKYTAAAATIVVDAIIVITSGPPAMNQLVSMAATIPDSITPLPRGPASKHADFAYTRSASSLQVCRSPPTSSHPRVF
jgi:hypothetical protein